MNKFYVMGEPKYIVVDDRLPATVWDETFFSNVSDNGAWWTPILEKAYAKLTKTYADLNAVYELEPLRALTGMPVEIFESSYLTETEIMNIITEADNRNYVMTASCWLS